jgi:hypothetical protein
MANEFLRTKPKEKPSKYFSEKISEIKNVSKNG